MIFANRCVFWLRAQSHSAYTSRGAMQFAVAASLARFCSPLLSALNDGGSSVMGSCDALLATAIVPRSGQGLVGTLRNRPLKISVPRNSATKILLELRLQKYSGHGKTTDTLLDYARASRIAATSEGTISKIDARAWKVAIELHRSPVDRRAGSGWRGLLLEFRHIEQQMRIAREERLLDRSQANRELIRDRAHEIKNPLGGIRGAAQLLDRELERLNAARVRR